MKKKILLLLILFIGLYFRFNNLNWDENFHLHPDERFLTMVGNAMVLPKTFEEYLNQDISKINPKNIGFNFYVYGTFPVLLNKYLAVYNLKDNYNDFTLQGRYLSAFFDLMIIVLVYKTSQLLLKDDKLALLSAFFYAIAVYPIQSSHFFTTDTFLNFFMFASFFFFLKATESKKRKSQWMNIVLSAITFGLASASKASAIYILPLIISIYLLFSKTVFERRLSLKNFLVFGCVFVFVSYLTLRLADPYYFANPSLFNPWPSKNFIDNIRQLESFDNPNIWYPPGVQWITKPITFLLTNLAFFGVGLPYFLFLTIGLLKIFIDGFRSVKKRKLVNGSLFVSALWVTLYFIYQSLQYVKSIRYTIYLYPFFAIFAAIGINQLFILGLRITNSKIVRYSLFAAVGLTLLIWPVAFNSIYLNRNTRILASEWIYKNIPNGRKIVWEYWDDPLPLGVLNPTGKSFSEVPMGVFDPDGPEKMDKIYSQLSDADYYILSSNRAWASIMSASKKYPLMSKFYKKLLSNQTNYKLVKEFTSYPQINFHFSFFNFHFTFPDDWAEETFTVYDHPKVMIFKNEKKS